jgi:hypothetical protein
MPSKTDTIAVHPSLAVTFKFIEQKNESFRSMSHWKSTLPRPIIEKCSSLHDLKFWAVSYEVVYEFKVS